MNIKAAFVFLSLAGSGFATMQNQLQPSQPSPQQAAEFGEKMKKEVPEIMKDRHIPGVALLVVREGQIIFSKGFGFADLDSGRPVDPEKTIFRAGSVSKLLTATAVMQLVERGQLDLNADVNRYLRRFRIADTFPRPVTTADLLTHTAGFAEYIHGSHTLDESRYLPLGEYLARRMPPRIRPPGEIFSYNDHGICLAGLLVQEISGIPFESYVEDNIFQPLGMVRSSFRQRLAPALQGDLATGYHFVNGRSEPYSLDYCQVVPAAGLYTTAYDIARFMIAQLQLGQVGDVRVLEAETAREMQQRHFAHHPKLRGRAYGFSELFVNGQRAIFHDGGMPGFNTRLCLVPDRSIGFFLAWNNDDLSLKGNLTGAFFDHFCPQTEKPPAVLPQSVGVSRVEDLGGYYVEIAGFSNSGLRMGSMMMNYIPVAATNRNTLAALGTEYSEVEPHLFQDKDGFLLAFRPEQKGQRQIMFLGTGALERLPWYETPNALLFEAAGLVLVFLPVGLIWPGGMLLGGKKFASSWRKHLPAGRFLAGLTGFLILFFLAGYVILFFQMEHYWQIMRNEFPWTWMTRLLFIPLVSSVLSLVLPVYAVAAWIRKRGTLVGRAYFTLATVAAFGFIWILHNWSLLGFKY